MNTIYNSIVLRGPRINYPKIGLLFFMGVLIASSWLIFPYVIQDQKLLQRASDFARLSKASSVSRYLTRDLIFHPQLEIHATFATPEFFQYVDRASVVANLRPDRNLIFFVSENIHEGQLSLELPEVVLEIDGKEYFPAVAEGPSEAEHHRVNYYSFPQRDADGKAIDLHSAAEMRLYVSNHYLGSRDKLTFAGTWNAPFELPEELASRADVTPVIMLALGAGLLSSVLTPCLLQLVVMFASVIAGFSTIPDVKGVDARNMTPVIRRKVMFIALAFVIGFTALYTLAGAVIGAVGHQAQLLFAEYSRTVAVISGIVVILLGIWVGFRGWRPVACRLPDPSLVRSVTRRDAFATVIGSMGYALGCTACFGGAIVATLIVYVGAIGSAAIGAGIMATFSIGVAIPFLLAALFLSRTESILIFLAEKARMISLLTMVLIIIFGMILVTDNFHTVSDFIYPYLGLD